MPCVTYLSSNEIRDWASVPDDKDFDELLQELRRKSGDNWLVSRHPIQSRHANFWKRLFCKPPEPWFLWTLYCARVETQVMNLVTPDGGSNFYHSRQSREDIMNYMLGYLGGLTHTPTPDPKP